jgi:hypothetical protein
MEPGKMTTSKMPRRDQMANVCACAGFLPQVCVPLMLMVSTMYLTQPVVSASGRIHRFGANLGIPGIPMLSNAPDIFLCRIHV